MVLEDSSTRTSRGDSLDHSAPVSDEDPFATSQSGVTRYHIDKSLLRPFPIFGRLLGFNDKTLDKLLQAQLNTIQREIHRPATQEEVDAFSYWAAKQLSISSYGAPLGIAAGAGLAYRKAETFRFPFWQPNLETFRPDLYPSTVAIFKGNRAIMAWHATRLLLYSGLGAAFGNILFQGYSGATGAIGMTQDKRLKGMTQALREQLEQKRGISQKQRPPFGGRKPGLQGDTSPTTSMYGGEGAGLDNRYGSGGVSDNIPREEAPARSQYKGSNDLPQTETQEDQDTGFSTFDDASPTGGQGVGADTAPQQGGSAWERLRRGGKPTQSWPTRQDQPTESAQPPSQNSWSRLQKASQQGQQNGFPERESFTVSEAPEDRERARIQAQKEFDAQVERERQGGQFGDCKGDQKRW